MTATLTPRIDARRLATYLVTDREQCQRAGRSVAQTVSDAVCGGVTCVQLRMKDATDSEFLREIESVSTAIGRRVPLIINDRVDVFEQALATGLHVAGVHVGLHDADPIALRDRLGPTAIIGVSARKKQTIERLQHAADYFGIGPVHDTSSKHDAPPGIGFDRLAELTAHSRIPVVAIGGLTAGDTSPIKHAGAAGMAIVSAICAAPNPFLAARDLQTAWSTL